jgi:putative transposase
VPRAQRRAPGKPLAYYVRLPDPKDGMRRAYASGDYTLAQIADHFGVHCSTVSRALRRRSRT